MRCKLAATWMLFAGYPSDGVASEERKVAPDEAICAHFINITDGLNYLSFTNESPEGHIQPLATLVRDGYTSKVPPDVRCVFSIWQRGDDASLQIYGKPTMSEWSEAECNVGGKFVVLTSPLCTIGIGWNHPNAPESKDICLNREAGVRYCAITIQLIERDLDRKPKKRKKKP